MVLQETGQMWLRKAGSLIQCNVSKLNYFEEYEESIILILTLLEIVSVNLASDETRIADGQRYVF